MGKIYTQMSIEERTLRGYRNPRMRYGVGVAIEAYL